MRRYRTLEAAQSMPRYVVIRVKLQLPAEFASHVGLPDGLTIPLKLVFRVRRHAPPSPFARLVRTATSPRLPQAWMN